jgi:ribosomal protein L32E
MAKTKLTERQRFWLKHLESADARKQPLADYARAHKLDAAHLYAYRSRFKRRDQKSAASPFVQVAYRAPDAVRIELPNGIVLSVTGAVNLPELITELGRLR